MKSRGGVVCCFATFATAATFAAFPAFPAFANRFGADACFVLDAPFRVRDFAGDFRGGVFARRAAGVADLGFAGPRFDALGFDALGFDALGFDALGFDALGFDALGFDALGFDAFGARRAGAAGRARPEVFAAGARCFRGAAFFTAFLTLATPRLRLVTDVARIRHFFGIQSTNGATNVNSNRT